jgi:hypothetical protein
MRNHVEVLAGTASQVERAGIARDMYAPQESKERNAPVHLLTDGSLGEILEGKRESVWPPTSAPAAAAARR